METTNKPVIKPDRKTSERNRRVQMKSLIYKLTSLVPPQHFKPSKKKLPQRDQLDQVAGYIKKMREKVDNLEKRKEEILITGASSSSSLEIKNDKNVENSSLKAPVIKVKDVGSSLEVVIITGKERKLALHEIVRAVEEEGAEVISATVSTVGLHVYHILHAQVKILRFGVDSSMICNKFEALISKIYI